MSFRIGLTGGIATGKTTVANAFVDLKINVIDADKIAHTLTQPGADAYEAVIEQFGDICTLENAELNRPYLRDLIFNNHIAKSQLEAILHPLIIKEMTALADNDNNSYVILMIPLLFEMSLQPLVSRSLTVDIPEILQFSRLLKRDEIAPDLAKKIISQQCSRAQRLQLTDDIIDNSGTKEWMTKQVHQLHERYLELSR